MMKFIIKNTLMKKIDIIEELLTQVNIPQF